MLRYHDEDKTYSQVFPNAAGASPRFVKIKLRICGLSPVEATFNIYCHVQYISAITMVNLLQQSIISCKLNFISKAVLLKLYQTNILYIHFRYVCFRLIIIISSRTEREYRKQNQTFIANFTFTLLTNSNHHYLH